MSTEEQSTEDGTSESGSGPSLKALLVGFLGAFFVTTILPSCFTFFCIALGIVVGLTVDPGAGLYAGCGVFAVGSLLGIVVMLIADYEPSNKKSDGE